MRWCTLSLIHTPQPVDQAGRPAPASADATGEHTRRHSARLRVSWQQWRRQQCVGVPCLLYTPLNQLTKPGGPLQRLQTQLESTLGATVLVFGFPGSSGADSNALVYPVSYTHPSTS